jgi:hypothetical protein
MTMAFRLDRISATAAGVWRIDIKGIGGRGEYGTLWITDAGLQLSVGTPSHPQGVLVPDFSCPNTADAQMVSRLVASTLLNLGWGPEVDQSGVVVDSAEFVYQPAGR